MRTVAAIGLSVIAAAGGCRSDRDASKSSETAALATDAAVTDVRTQLRGMFRAVLTSPGGELPFLIEFTDGGKGAVVINGDERAAVSGVDVSGTDVTLRFDHYDARIEARWDAAKGGLVGAWRKTTPKGESTLPFAAAPGTERFPRASAVGLVDAGAGGGARSVGGRWSTVFRDDDGVYVAVGELVHDPAKGDRVTGTFLTETGDYRYLDGVFRAGELRLSTFDGAHAFLFSAALTADDRLRGEFWSRDTYRATFLAERAPDGKRVLADGFTQVKVTSKGKRFRFAFDDIDGARVTSEDERFAGKALIVDIFGTWCPNCNDMAPVLAKWHREYRDRGLEVVGLAFEYTGDPKRDREMLRRYKKRYGIEFPLLLAGVSDKEQAAAALPDLSAVKAYPTTLFINRRGKVVSAHSGFAGPGTGEHNTKLLTRLEGIVRSIVDSKPPAAPKR